MASMNMNLTLFLLFSSWVFLGYSQSMGLNTFLQGGSSESAASMPCVQKLLPCKEYLKPPVSMPPASCCVPLKEMLTDDVNCLCRVFDNPEILKSFNVTQDDALKLPKACGSNADISLCKKAAGMPASSASSPPSSDDSKSAAAAYGVSQFGGSGLAALFLALLFISAFQA
ncbi:non-specific lipid transfer protein GPI-anchored 3-like [Juglans microcarpa x Juglans regia]|uniref:non-specific lipid transfer protein GPI-anchored 3-like n=1 Tax=Juglans microcarpa x Juglans regia TaxID=2249226 RepID=UPI001B7EB3E4|nr:non-specific lipid transfer protein GPI-anchored 3-like [Juglans microcarpa x Juglans regia]